jgi:hypothetical protein
MSFVYSLIVIAITAIAIFFVGNGILHSFEIPYELTPPRAIAITGMFIVYNFIKNWWFAYKYPDLLAESIELRDKIKDLNKTNTDLKSIIISIVKHNGEELRVPENSINEIDASDKIFIGTDVMTNETVFSYRRDAE